MFVTFVIYPICYGLWLGSQPELYSQTVRRSAVARLPVLNMMIYVGVAVNLKMMLALSLVGLLRACARSWWTKSLLLVFITAAWATPALLLPISIHWLMNGQWGMLNNVLYLLFGINGPIYLNDHFRDRACIQHWGLHLEDRAVLDDHHWLAGRMAVPQELYEGSRGGWR